jgi:hypothetical protein
MKNIKIIFFLFYILSIFKFNLNAQNLKEFTRDIIKEEMRIFSFPFRAQKDDLHLTAGIVGSGIILYSYDEKIRNSVPKLQSNFNTNFLKIAKEFGNGGYDILFITGYGITGSIIKDDYMKETAFMAGESFISANILGTIIKYSVGRARPYTGDGKSKFTPFVFKTSRASFPSGHTVSAFSVATVFAERSNSILIKILFYATASATAFERIYFDKHWSSDVFFGATLGYLIGKDIVKGNNKSDTILVYPFNKGIMLAFRI